MTTLDTTTLRAELIEILRREMYVTKESIEDEDELISDLGLDSANIAIGQVAIEQQLRVTLTHQNIIDCSTFGALVTIVANALLRDVST